VATKAIARPWCKRAVPKWSIWDIAIYGVTARRWQAETPGATTTGTQGANVEASS
jgi:hypothetical protein